MSWDLLRCGFVLMVVLYHSTFIGPRMFPELAARHVMFAHQIGASLLLVLSSYFVAATLPRRGRGRGEDRGVARWWWSRMARMVPPFTVATVAAWAALRYLGPPTTFHPNLGTLAANLLMLWNWTGVGPRDYVDGSYWTIPLQLMAFTAAALLGRTRVGRGRGLRVLLWVGVLLPLAQWPLEGILGLGYTAVVEGFGLYRWHLFVAGVAVWMISTGRLRWGPGGALLATCVVAHAVQTGTIVGDGSFSTDWWSVFGVAAGIVAMCLAGCGADVGTVLASPVSRAVTWVARNSYGVFLVHQTLGYVLMLRLQEAFGIGPGWQTLTMIANGVLLGWVLTRWVERPAHRALLRVWDRRAAALGPAGALGRRRSAPWRGPAPVREGEPTSRPAVRGSTGTAFVHRRRGLGAPGAPASVHTVRGVGSSVRAS